MTQSFDPVLGALTTDGWFPSPAHVLRRAAVLDHFSAFPPGRLLEMGCGAGRLLIDWDRLGHHGWGNDLDPTARLLASRCVETFGARFEIGVEPPESEIGRFDYLVALEVIEHLTAPAEVLGRWAQFLRKDGILLISAPAFQRLWGKSDEWAGHVKRYEPAELVDLIKSVGFEPISVATYGFPIGNVLRIAGNVASGLKMKRNRQGQVDREAATYASGHDRSIENKLSPLMTSGLGKSALKAASRMQRAHFSKDRGIGLIVVARKTAP